VQKGNIVEQVDAKHEDMPCGRCDIGAYSMEAMLNPVARKYGALSVEQRISHTPKCKTYNRTCVGAQDFHACLVELDSRCFSSPQPSQSTEKPNEQ
jgi:hypothetical protein